VQTIPSTFYDFGYTNFGSKSSIVHFQLRNLCWATSKNHVYFSKSPVVYQWNALTRELRTVLDLQVTSSLVRQGAPAMWISSLCCKDDWMFVGGFKGEYVLRSLNTSWDAPVTHGVITTEENGITNYVDLFPSRAYGTFMLVCNGDSHASTHQQQRCYTAVVRLRHQPLHTRL
jgi:hypothetical protein